MNIKKGIKLFEALNLCEDNDIIDCFILSESNPQNNYKFINKNTVLRALKDASSSSNSCYQYAFYHLFILNNLEEKKDKNIILYFGNFESGNNMISHMWLECDGEIFEAGKCEDQVKMHKLHTTKKIYKPHNKLFTATTIAGKWDNKALYEYLEQLINDFN